MRALRFTARRLIFLLPQLLGITAVTFVLIHLIPGNPAYQIAGPNASPETIQAISERLGLDKPIWSQFLIYLGRGIRGDLGGSWYTGRPVTADIAQRAPATLELITASLLIAVVFAVPLGALAAFRKGTIVDRATIPYGLLAGAMPDFLLALIVIFVFFHLVPIFPAPVGRIGLDVTPPHTITGFMTVDSLLSRDWQALLSSLQHLALPSFTLAFLVGGTLMKLTRSTVRSVLESNFIMYARASGLQPRTVFAYALRNALTPIVTLLGFIFSFLISGAVLIETIFSWGGLGQYAVQAILNSDYLALQGFVAVATVFSILIYLCVDIAYFALDPRVR